MPQRPIASTIRSWFVLFTRGASLCTSGWTVFFAVTAWCVFLFLGSMDLSAQATPASPSLGNAAAAHRRTQQFLAGRTRSLSKSAQAEESAPGDRRQSQQSSSDHLGEQAIAAVSSANLSVPWQPLGPVAVTTSAFGAVTGRITSIALDPNDATGNTVYLGTTGGGVWKSTNAAGPLSGVSFAPLTDTLPAFSANEGATTVPSLSIGAVAVQPAATGVVLAGTGDPNDATDSYYGEGILRSVDGGQTWTLVIGSRDGANGAHSFAGLATAGFAWSTATPTLVVAAMSNSLEGYVVDATGAARSVPGLYFSSDAGLTWRMSTVYDGSQLVQSPEPPGFPQSGNAATAVVWDAPRGLFIAALAGHGYYGSPDGQTWSRLANQPGSGLTTAHCPVGVNGRGSPDCPILRGALAVQPVTGDVYALTVDANDNDDGLWQDLCTAGANGRCANAAPVFAYRLDGGALEIGQGVAGASTTIVQGSYNLALAATPGTGGDTVLFAGTLDLYRCDLAAGSAACTLRNTTNAGNGCNAPAMVAPAQHALAAVVQSAGQPLLYVGNDGGLWRSLDGVAETGSACSASDGGHFDNLNGAVAKGGSLAEVVGFAQHPTLPDTLLAGLGALGSAATTTAGTLPPWPQLSAGEGGYPQLDPSAPMNWYVSIGAGVNLKLCPVGDACTAADFLFPATVGEPQVGNDAALLDPATLLDPQNTAELLLATCRVWRGPAQTGAGWNLANALSPAMDGDATPCNLNSAFIRSLGAGGPISNAANTAHAGSEVLYAGMAGTVDGGGPLGGHVFVTKHAEVADSTTPWTDTAYNPVLNSSLPFNSGGFDISSVVPDAHDPTGATVYATVMGFGPHPHVYRSVDFGAHWADVTENLPQAPANSLVIDPNNANMVYVALDSGVWVTGAISTCATANSKCWSLLGTALPNAPVTELLAGPQLPTADGRLGMLRAATYGRGIWQTPLLSAIPLLQPKLVARPQTLHFSAQPAATQSPAQIVTLTSTGSSPASIASVITSGDFVETDTCSGQTIAVGATCSVSVQFAPTAAGARTGVLTIYANVVGGQVTVPLNGEATAAAAIVLTPLSLGFPSTLVNQTAPTEIITVSNTGGNPASLQSFSITGDFAIVQNTCGASLPSQTGCSLGIAFTPTASGARHGVLTITDSAGAQMAQLSGIGEAPATDTLSPLALSFGVQQVGTTSAAQQVILTNAGDVALTLINATITDGDFTAANGCGSSLAAHSTCAVAVAFVPTATGARSGTLRVTDGVRFQTVALSGTGVAPPGVSLTPRLLTFADVGVGLNSPVQSITLTNQGGLALAIASSTISGDFAVASSTCGADLPVGGSCTFGLFFAPSAAGVRTGALTLIDNAPSGTQTVSLTGTGIDFSLIPNGATSVTIPTGSTATFPLALSSLAGLSGNVALSCTGAPAHSLCTVNPATAPLGNSLLVSVVVQTNTNKADLHRWRLWPRQNELLFAAAPLGWIGWRRRRRMPGKDGRRTPGLVALICFGICFCFAVSVFVGGLAGCGAARTLPLDGSGGGADSPATPTPSGTYNIVVTGATAGVSHTVDLTLTVQ